LFLPDGCCHLIEATTRITSNTANLILFDTDSITTTTITNEFEGNTDHNSVAIKLILDNIEDHIRIATLETLPSVKSEIIGSFEFFGLKNEMFCFYFSTNLCQNNY
jgi:hypothetical protein